MQQLKDAIKVPAATGYVKDWRDAIPRWSHWAPGMPGDPFHEKCLGTGYVRIDAPVGTRHFGKIYLCTCTVEMARKMGRPLKHPEEVITNVLAEAHPD